MKKMKKSKKGIIIGICIFFAIILIFFTIFFIVPSFESNTYGNRLDDINSYKISSSVINDIKSLKNEDGIQNVTYRKEGRILNFIVTFDEGYNQDSAKKIADDIVNKISKKNKKYYDIQIYLTDKKSFTTIGYHAKESNAITWTKAGDSSES